MDSNESQYYRDRISDAWADIRAYGSNLWQIVALNIATSAVIVNLISRLDEIGSLIFFGLGGWIGLWMLSGFTFFSMMMVLWISGAINERVELVEQLTKKIDAPTIPRVTRVKRGNATIIGVQAAGKGRSVSEILSWLPTKDVARFSDLMWVFSVLAWFVQMYVGSNGDWVMTFTLLAVQTVMLILMIYIRMQKRRT